MGKLRNWLLPVLILCLLAVGLLAYQEDLPGWEAPEYLPPAAGRRIQKELREIAQLCREVNAPDTDAMEAYLIASGYAVVDTDAVYPDHLGNPEGIYRFWEDLSNGSDASQTVIRVTGDGGFRHLFFLRENGEDLFCTTEVAWDAEGEWYVCECTVLPIYDMDLAEWGIFYYRLAPADDPHYIDYNQFRLTPIDREAYDLTRKYILPVGYQMTNLFLCDWQEGTWGSLSLTDQLEYLYRMDTGEDLPWEKFPYQSARVLIPAGLFEDTLLSYFAISREELQGLCQYEKSTDSYLWRPIDGDDLTTWHYPMCEPMVTSWWENSDGTMTLEVQVYSPELKTDRLFLHEVIVRPLADGAFQYVSNRVTYVSDRGLPPNMARFALDDTN